MKTQVVTTYEFDDANRVTKVTDNLGHFRQLGYDPRGYLISEKDEAGHETGYKYDDSGRRTEIDRPEGIVTKFDFDGNDNLAMVTAEPGDRETLYGYDLQNRLLSVTYPDTKSLTYGYDEDGNVVSETESPGSTITITPDESGRPLRRDFTKGTGVEGPDFESFTYDALGRVVSADNGQAKVDMAYDSLDSMTGDQLTTLAGIYSTGKVYDLAGNPISINYPSGRSITLVPDPLDRIAAIREGGNLIGSFVFQGPGLTAKKLLGNNLSVATTFDGVRRPIDLLAADPAGNPALHHQYGWTPTNRKSFATLSDGKSSVYGYDTALRLTSELIGVPGDPGNPSGAPAATKAFGYDTANALTSLNDSRIGPRAGSNDSVNRLISLGALTVNWDTEGNLSTKSSGDHIVYDAAHRPVRMEHADGSVESFRYDPLGRRFEKSITVGATTNTTTEVSCGEHVIAEYMNGRLDREYVWGNEADELVQVKRDTDGDGTLDQTLYPLTDEMNTVHALTDQNGQVVERYAYEADGRSTVLGTDFSPRSFSLFGNTITWQGRPWTGTCGYFRNRWLDAESHSWITPDPAHYPDNIANTYAPFGRDGGVNTTDPWGLWYLVSVREDFRTLTWRRRCDRPGNEGCIYASLNDQPAATIFVHGYNVDSEHAIYREEHIEARLNKAGYHGSVIGFTWPGNVGLLGGRDVPEWRAFLNFIHDVGEARKSGAGLAQLVREIRANTKPGLKLNLLSHSLGAEALLSGLAGC
jgi:YD repeat-containing protein